MESEGQRPGLGHYHIGVVEIEDRTQHLVKRNRPDGVWLRMSTLPHASSSY